MTSNEFPCRVAKPISWNDLDQYRTLATSSVCGHIKTTVVTPALAGDVEIIIVMDANCRCQRSATCQGCPKTELGELHIIAVGKGPYQRRTEVAFTIRSEDGARLWFPTGRLDQGTATTDSGEYPIDTEIRLRRRTSSPPSSSVRVAVSAPPNEDRVTLAFSFAVKVDPGFGHTAATTRQLSLSVAVP